MRKIKLLLIVLFAFSRLCAVDISIEQNSTDSSKLLDNKTKSYFGEQIFRGNFKENRQFRYNPNYLINIGDIISVKLWGAFDLLLNLLLISRAIYLFQRWGR